jgi:hypothetical protein
VRQPGKKNDHFKHLVAAEAFFVAALPETDSSTLLLRIIFTMILTK